MTLEFNKTEHEKIGAATQAATRPNYGVKHFSEAVEVMLKKKPKYRLSLEIRAAMKKRKLGIQKLADLTGFTKSAMNHFVYDTGDNRLSLPLLIAVVKALGMKLSIDATQPESFILEYVDRK